MTRMGERVAWFLFGLIAGFLLAVIVPSPAMPHENGMHYPMRCCSGTDVGGDCSPVEGLGQITRAENGWFIKATGETIPFDKTEPSTDLRFHRCVKPDNTTRCFFAPESGT